MKEQTFVSNVNERSKALENESFPLAFSKLALLRKCVLGGELRSKLRLEWAEAEVSDEWGPHLGAWQFFPVWGCECQKEAAAHRECGERIPGVPVASQEEALSTRKARGTPGSCHHSQIPPDVSVHSRAGSGRSKGMATYSSILAWRILMDRGAWWAAVHGVPGVRHDWVT